MCRPIVRAVRRDVCTGDNKLTLVVPVALGRLGHKFRQEANGKVKTYFWVT